MDRFHIGREKGAEPTNPAYFYLQRKGYFDSIKRFDLTPIEVAQIRQTAEMERVWNEERMLGFHKVESRTVALRRLLKFSSTDPDPKFFDQPEEEEEPETEDDKPVRRGNQSMAYVRGPGW